MVTGAMASEPDSGYDAVIVGARVAGAATALLLAPSRAEGPCARPGRARVRHIVHSPLSLGVASFSYVDGVCSTN